MGGAALLYGLTVRGALTVDLGIGRKVLPLGPVAFEIAAPAEVVFGVIATPYLGRTPRALREKLEVWERGKDMVLAAHYTRVRGLTATTLETVRFDPPSKIDFRLVRGPVPHLSESFTLTPEAPGTVLTWAGEVGADLWALGSWWAARVGRAWEQAVRASIEAVKAEAERRTLARRGTPAG
jgi:hypothetical protein